MARTVVITGCSRGIGRDLAEHLAGRGWDVFAGARDDARADELRDRTADLPGLSVLTLDVTRDDQVAAAADRVAEQLAGAPLHGLVNNAAIAIAGPLEHTTAAELRAVLDVNLVGVARVGAALLPLLRRGGGGRIVNVGSTSGGLATPLMGPYCASKAALEALTDTWRRELHGSRIAVSLVAPGPVATGTLPRLLRMLEELDERLPAEARERYGALIDGLSALAAAGEERAIPARTVTLAIERALTARRPRRRYDPGLHATLSRRVLHRLPTALVDLALRRTLARAADRRRRRSDPTTPS